MHPCRHPTVPGAKARRPCQSPPSSWLVLTQGPLTNNALRPRPRARWCSQRWARLSPAPCFCWCPLPRPDREGWHSRGTKTLHLGHTGPSKPDFLQRRPPASGTYGKLRWPRQGRTERAAIFCWERGPQAPEEAVGEERAWGLRGRERGCRKGRRDGRRCQGSGLASGQWH